MQEILIKIITEDWDKIGSAWEIIAGILVIIVPFYLGKYRALTSRD